MRNPRRRVPPRDKTARRRYYALMGAARRASTLAQHLHLLQLARGLMVWVEVDPAEAGMRSMRSTIADAPPGASGRRKRPSEG